MPDANALETFEAFLFGRERRSLRLLASSLLDLQSGECFYCGAYAPKGHVDHFFPWAHSGDDGVDNLVMACGTCNGSKSATLPAGDHVEAWVGRNARFANDLRSISLEKSWPRDRERTWQIGRGLFALAPAESPTWSVGGLSPLGPQRQRVERLLA